MTWKPLILAVIIFLLSLIFIGCTPVTEESYLADGYQVGDLTKITLNKVSKINQARLSYCDKTQELKVRKVALALLNFHYPVIPDDGICPTLKTEKPWPKPDKAKQKPDCLGPQQYYKPPAVNKYPIRIRHGPRQ